MRLSWFNVAGQLDAIEFDTFLRENREGTNTVGDNPVGGRVYSDHVVVGPQRFTFDCYVSDSPSEVPETHTGGVSGSVQSVDLAVGKSPEMTKAATHRDPAEYENKGSKATASVLKFDGELRRRDLVHRELERLRKNVIPVYVTEAVLCPIDAAVLTRVSVAIDDGSDGCVFTIELREILVADSALGELVEPDEPRAIAPVDGGGTTTEEIEEGSVLWNTGRAAGLW